MQELKNASDYCDVDVCNSSAVQYSSKDRSYVYFYIYILYNR